MILPHEARQEILARIEPLPPEEIDLTACAGRSLAERIVSPEAIPPFDNTAMDGFAVRHVDLRAASP